MSTIQNLTKAWTISSSCTSVWWTSRVIFLLSLLVLSNGYPQFEDTNDPTNSNIALQNMLVDGADIYVGSVNRLYKLSSSDLSEVVAFDTGPVPDNRLCRPPRDGYVCESTQTDTDDVNKLLLMYDGKLITCSNLYQGTCQFRNLNTLELDTRYTREVVSNYYDGRAVGFIGPGSAGDNLYTATPLGDWLRSGIPTMARRYLEPDPVFGDDPFDIISGIVIPQPTLTVATVMGKYVFNVSYVHGFSSGSHSYYVALQVEDYKSNGSPIRTKISRMCNQDSGEYFNSYIELPLKCTDGVTDYNLAQSAFIASVGSHLDNVKPAEDVLFITFSESTGLSSLEPTSKSAVCVYSVRAIDVMMAERRIECFGDESDTDNTQIEWLGNSACSPDQSVVNSVQADPSGYCYEGFSNTPLGTLNFVLEESPLYTTDETVFTAIVATPYQEETVIFLGDDQGSLRKLRVTSNTTSELYETMRIDLGSPVQQNGLAFDATKDHIYVMTERKITKVPVQECAKYTHCADCTLLGNGVGNPYCGWCSLPKSCTRKHESECADTDDLNVTLCLQDESVLTTNTPTDKYTEVDNGEEFGTIPATVEFMTDRTNIAYTTQSSSSGSEQESILYWRNIVIAVCAAVGVFLCIIIFVVIYLMRRLWKKTQEATHVGENNHAVEMPLENISETIHRMNAGGSLDVDATNAGASLDDTYLPPMENLPVDFAHVTFDHLRFIKELGSGQYGSVWLAETNIKTRIGIVTKVAVKTNKDDAPASEKNDLMREMKLMKKFKPHPNVLELLASFSHEESHYLILEFMANGMLRDVLRESRRDYDYAYTTKRDTQSSLSQIQVMMFAKQVADGMNFITSSSNHCVHRDLAARNVLVSEDLVCKVSDFGLAREEDEYHRKSDLKLPLRWMAIESLVDGIHTAESDVWSYGVLLWEIVTLGARPYPGMGTRVIQRKVRQGYRMPQPSHCLQEVYDLMLACWSAKPSERPSFADISRNIDMILDIKTDYILLNEIDDHLYDDIAAIDDDEKI